jgi:hypothetical protein
MLKIISHAAARSVSSSLVIALHCSGGIGQQWQKLAPSLHTAKWCSLPCELLAGRAEVP